MGTRGNGGGEEAPIELVLGRLDGVKGGGNGYVARCPGHEDREQSLSVAVGDNGKILLHCFAGCTVEAIIGAIGLSMRDLFVADGRARGGRRAAKRRDKSNGGEKRASSPESDSETAMGGLTLEQYAAAKQLPVDFLRGLGLSDVFVERPSVRIPYFDSSGCEVAVRFRCALAGPNRFRWKRGNKPLLYGLSRLGDMRAAGHVALVEGESDCHTLWFHDVAALGIPGASNWREEWAEHLAGIETVYVLIEPDHGGEAVRKWLSESSIRERARLVHLPDGVKDPSALHLADSDNFKTAWQAALEAAIPWADTARANADARRRDAWTRCATLAADPALLDRVADTVEQLGVVGEGRAVRLLYLAVTSRLLARPVSIAMKGPSSVGKSYLVERVLGFFPTSAFYALSAMSERALAYSKEPVKHRMLVIYEAAGLKSEFASYLVRSLLSEGRVRYETVEKTKDGLQPRLIEREGPTGLIVTTTALKLHPENETRLVSVPVTDTAAQTTAILNAQAAESTVAVDLEPWHALQTWLEATEHRVAIPYAPGLAAAIPPVAVRLRRDFPAVLSLIRAHTVLHQGTRERDATGRIIATVGGDYAAVRALVHDLVADSAEATVSPTMRETVAAAARLLETGADEVPVRWVAWALRLDKAAALRRVQAAIGRGYLHNREERKGRPARLVLGDPLPDEYDILPPPEALDTSGDRGNGCTVAGDFEGIKLPPSPLPDAPWLEGDL